MTVVDSGAAHCPVIPLFPGSDITTPLDWDRIARMTASFSTIAADLVRIGATPEQVRSLGMRPETTVAMCAAMEAARSPVARPRHLRAVDGDAEGTR